MSLDSAVIVTNIKETDDILHLTTNAGVLRTNKKATVPSFGKLWFSEASMTNVFCLAMIQDWFPVAFILGSNSHYTVLGPNSMAKFIRSSGNLYYYKPKYKPCFVKTVK